MRVRRIAFVTPLHFGPKAYFGGGERYPLNIARGLIAADPFAQVDLIGVGDPARTVAPQPRLNIHMLPVTLAGTNVLDHISSAMGDVVAEADLVHIHQAFTRASQLSLLIAKFLGKPVALTDHGALTNHVERAVGYLDLVDLFICQSQFAAEQISGGERRVVIPGGVDDQFFRPSARSPEREFMLFVGRLLPHKGIDRMLSALPPDLPCVIAGRAYDVSYARYLRALAAGRNVRFLHTADDLVVRDLYRRAWATIVPSVSRDAWGGTYEAAELMGLTALESMACGTPTIVSSTAALPEFVDNGSTGFVFEGLTELRDQARLLADAEVDSDHLGRNARELVENEYSLTVAGERIWNAYQTLRGPEIACVS
jgi:glycosyltransferase involved in cell wall biosynthesis